MKREQILALKATFFIVIAIIISCFSLFSWILWDNSIFDFFKDIFYWIFSNKLTTLSAFLSILIISFIIYLIVYYFWKKHFEKIDNYNKNLKDYNHYLAHELKTPISVIFSNLEVLKYWFDEKIVKKSQEELKNMINIIDVLLSFSESLNISERDDINLENFLKSYINSYFSDQKNNIFIENREFNFYIETNEILFKRIVRNLIENALKYSKDKKLFIKIENKKIIFENKIEKDYTEEEIQKLISPKKNIFKKYIATLESEINQKEIEKLEKWVIIDENYRTKKAKVKLLESKKIEISISEGKFHQIKKMLETVNNKVLELKRIEIWELKLWNLKVWEWRYLNDEETKYLQNL